MRRNEVASTQDAARGALVDLPVLVLARSQTAGRGRGGDRWLNAERALAASLAFRPEAGDARPFSLMAGVAAARVVSGAGLKWPNDVMVSGEKAGGALVERSGDAVTVGLGINLWWPEAPEGMVGVFADDPGDGLHAEIGALWGAELMGLIDGDGWPRAEYTRLCVTVGRRVVWAPDGHGDAVGVAADGGLIVERDGERETIYAGAVNLIRRAP